MFPILIIFELFKIQSLSFAISKDRGFDIYQRMSAPPPSMSLQSVTKGPPFHYFQFIIVEPPQKRCIYMIKALSIFTFVSNVTERDF